MSEAKGKLVIKREGKEREEKSETFGMGGVGKTNFLLRLLFIKPKQESMLKKSVLSSLLAQATTFRKSKLSIFSHHSQLTTHNSQQHKASSFGFFAI